MATIGDFFPAQYGDSRPALTVQIIALTIALKMKTVIVNPPIVSDTYVFIAIINELGGTAKIYNKRLFIDASTICNANIPFFLGKCIRKNLFCSYRQSGKLAIVSENRRQKFQAPI